MSEIELFIIIGIAGFALTHLLQETAGPGDIFQIIRCKLGVDLPIRNDAGNVVGYMPDFNPSGFIAKLYSCYKCLTTWICFMMLSLYILPDGNGNSIATLVLIWLASVGTSILLNDVLLGD